MQQIRVLKNKKQLEQDIDSLQREEKALESEKKNLDDPGYIEEIAREEYGMAKKNEKVYKVVPEEGE